MKTKVKSILWLLCVMAMLICVPASMCVKAAPTEGLNVENMQIVLPAEYTIVERTAAMELQDYIEKMTGKTIAVVHEGENAGAGIYIGNTEYAKTEGVAYPTEGDTKGEGWAIQVVGGDIVLCGAPERGVLYAVYHLLEDVLGVRWWNLWEEYVPSGPAIVPADYADSGVPVMEYREVYVGKETNTDYAFYVRNRVNGSMTHIPETYGGSEVYGAPAHVHTFSRYFKSADFGTHPEWFSMNERGQRVSDRQLCLSNEELQQEFAKRLIANVSANPDAIYSVCPNDNKYLCDCSDCKADIQTYGSAGYVLNFVNKMAKAVTAAGYPDTSIEMLVYWMYVDAPKGGVTPEPNVTIRYADNYTDLLHSVNHVNNTKSMNTLRKWADLSRNDLYYWQYVVNYRNNGIFPSMFHYGEDFTTLQEMGVNGWFAEQEQCINVDFWDMKLWLITKLMEKPVTGEEYAALMDEFIYGYYGEEAGKHIRDYLYYMNEKAEASFANQNFATYIISAEFLNARDIIAGAEYFDKAFAAAGDDWILQRRLRAARCGFDRVAYENFDRWEDQADGFGLTLPFTKRELGERICETMTEQITLRGQYDAEYMLFYPLYDQYTDDLPELPEELDDIAREHILECTADDFRLTNNYAVVEDKDSLLGKAVRGENRGAQMLDIEGDITVALYNPNGEGNEVCVIGYVDPPNIADDLGYQLYRFTFTVPYIGRNAYVYLFNDWGIQIDVLGSQLRDMEGQSVELCLSMKVDGTAFYIDRVVVLPESDKRSHHYVNDDEKGRSVCQICGDVILFDPDRQVAANPKEQGKMMLWLLVSGFAEVGIFAVLMFMIGRKKRRR